MPRQLRHRLVSTVLLLVVSFIAAASGVGLKKILRPQVIRSLAPVEELKNVFMPLHGHFQRCQHRLADLKFLSKIYAGPNVYVYEVEDPSGNRQVMKASIVETSDLSTLNCGAMGCPHNTVVVRADSGSKSLWNGFKLPNEVASGLLLNELKSKNFLQTLDWSFCQIAPQQRLPFLSEDPNRQFRKMLESHLHNKTKTTKRSKILMQYLFLEHIEPGHTLAAEFRNGIFEHAIVHHQSPEKALTHIREIMVQVLGSIYEAQMKLGFVHNDLHLQNLIMEQVPKELVQRYDVGRMMFEVPTFDPERHHDTGMRVKIIDYELSSIKHERAQVNNTNFEHLNGFHPVYDARLFAVTLLDELKPHVLKTMKVRVPKETWKQFTDMMRVAVGDRLISLILHSPLEEYNDWIIDYATQRKATPDRVSRELLDAFILVDGRNDKYFIERLLAHSFFEELRVY